MTKTHEEFLTQLKTINKNIEVLDHYTNSTTHVPCRCLKCGHEWSATPKNLLKGRGCPQCAAEASKNRYKKSQEQFESELKAISPNVQVIGDYVNTGTPIECKCSKCGKVWQARPADLLKGNLGCLCSKAPRRTREDFVEALSKKNKSVNLVGPFANMYTKTEFQCSVCGARWKTVPQSLMQGTGCPTCAVEKLKSPKITERDFLKRMNERYPDIEVLSKYIDSKHKVSVRCKICGYEWSASGTLLYTGKTGCSKCAGNIKKSHDEFVADIERISPHIEIIGRYTNAKSKVRCRCTICGSEIEMKANNLMNGQGCPACRKINQTSFPEQAIFYYVRQAFPEAVNSFNELGYELDVFIPSISTGIEYDGLKWHVDKTENDCIKNGNCLADGITLIRIREPGLEVLDDCICIVREDTSSSESLNNCIAELMDRLEASHADVDVERDSLAIQSQYRLMKKERSFAAMFPEIAKEWDYSKNNTLVPEMFSPGAGQKVWWICNACNHSWKSSIYDRIRGNGCPKCGRARAADIERKSNAQFLEELNIANSTVIPLEEYKGAQEPILCKCTKCSYEWKVRPAALICHKTGCPKCASEKTVNLQRKTNEAFLEELAAKNPNVEALQPYKSAHEKILVRCKLCGNEWLVSPANITRGRNCPKCYGKGAQFKKGDAFKKAIIQYDKEGNYIREYDSAVEAESATEVSRKSICNNLKNKTKSAGGFVWKYKDREK